jgi:PAS domain S-box-containing protein
MARDNNVQHLQAARRHREDRRQVIKSTAQELCDSRQRYATLIETLPHGVEECTVDGIITFSNTAHNRMLGYADNELIGRHIGELVPDPDERASLPLLLKRLAAEHPAPHPYVTQKLTKDKRRIDVQVDWNYELDEQGRVVGFIAVITDISHQMAATRALKESEQRYRAVFEGCSEGILLAEVETLRFHFANPAICAFLGYTDEELRDMSVPEIHPEKDRQWILEEFKSQARGGKVLVERVPCQHKAGHVVYADIRSGRVELDGRRFLVGFFADVTLQVGIKKALNEQILFLQTLIDTLPHPVFYKDRDGRYLGCNHAFEAFMGMQRDALVGKTVYDIAPRDLAEVYEAADKDLFESRRPQTYETSVRYADGTRRDVILNKAVFYHQDGSLAGLVGAMLDITERKRAEEEKALRERQLRQAQKMEAIGTLAGGIAHDFNNILSAIVGYTDIALHDLPADAPVGGYLKKVLQAGDRARGLVNQILAFSRATEQENRPVVVKHIAKEALKLLRATLPSTIRIQTNIRSGSAIMGDPTQIHQVIMNLCTNSAHAMQEKGGQLLVSLTDASLDEPSKDAHAELPPGDYLVLEVSDTGTGIDPEILDRIFDPFFTTKKPGEGTGMGLSVVHGIIRDCGGSIQVKSVPGRGTTFQAWLPAIEVEDKDSPPAETPLPLGHENILFVDDEPALVDVGLQMLTMLGYRVTAINDSQEALDRFRQSPRKFDMVITDMTMPRMTGDVLSQHLLAVRPDLPIIICTGYSDKVDPESIRSMGLAGLVYKPLIMRDLAELIRQVLDKRKADA